MNSIILVSLVVILFNLYYSKFTKLGKKINIYNIFPSNKDILSHKIIKYSRINYNGVDTLFTDRNMLYTINIKQHSKRSEKLKLYTKLRISKNIQLKLKIWINSVRYKPESSKYLELKNKWVKCI